MKNILAALTLMIVTSASAIDVVGGGSNGPGSFVPVLRQNGIVAYAGLYDEVVPHTNNNGVTHFIALFVQEQPGTNMPVGSAREVLYAVQCKFKLFKSLEVASQVSNDSQVIEEQSNKVADKLDKMPYEVEQDDTFDQALSEVVCGYVNHRG